MTVECLIFNLSINHFQAKMLWYLKLNLRLNLHFNWISCGHGKKHGVLMGTFLWQKFPTEGSPLFKNMRGGYWRWNIDVIQEGYFQNVIYSLFKLCALCVTYFFFEKLTRAVVKTDVEHNKMNTVLFIVSLLFCTKMCDWAWDT